MVSEDSPAGRNAVAKGRTVSPTPSAEETQAPAGRGSLLDAVSMKVGLDTDPMGEATALPWYERLRVAVSVNVLDLFRRRR